LHNAGVFVATANAAPSPINPFGDEITPSGVAAAAFDSPQPVAL